MEKATVYRAISAPTALIAGLLALGAAYWGYIQDPAYSDGPTVNGKSPSAFGFVAIWCSVLLVVGVANGWFLFRDARRRGEKFISNGMKMAIIALIPSYLTAGVLSAVNNATPEVLTFIWVLFHGLGLLATGHFSPRSIQILGFGFLLAGLTIVIVVHCRLSQLPSPHLLMALTFGLFHLIYAACTWPRRTAKLAP